MTFMQVTCIKESVRKEPSHRNAKLFQSLFRQSGICIAILNTGLRIVEMNSDFSWRFGDSPSVLRGRHFPELLHPADVLQLEAQLSQVVEGSRARITERATAVRANGSPMPVELTLIGVQEEGAVRVGEIIALVSPTCGSPATTAGDARGTEDEETNKAVVLTAAEAGILEQLATGISTQSLAVRLYLSRQGVEYHIRSLLRKLKVPNRTALVSRAYALGILPTGSWPPRVPPYFVHSSAPSSARDAEPRGAVPPHSLLSL